MSVIKKRKVRKIELCDECREEHEFGMVCRAYLRLQRARVGFDLTKLHVRPETEYYKIIDYYCKSLQEDETGILDRIKSMIEDQPLWDWCSIVSGLGHVAALTFHSFIRTHVHVEVGDTGVFQRVDIDTAGKPKKYFGLVPDAKLKSGMKAGFNPLAKGRVLGVIVKGIMMARRGKGDSYYLPLLDAKKYYYRNFSQYAPAMKDPKLCPKYEQCLKGYLRKAKREGRKPKKPTCIGHTHNMAMRWLGGIMVSHATQLIREGKGLDVTAFKNHHAYIHPKRTKDDVPNIELLEQIRTGKPE